MVELAAIHSAGRPERLHCTVLQARFSSFPSSASVQPMFVRPIDSLLPRASRNFGGKARNLAALVRAGFPVPAAQALSGEAALRTFARVLPRELQPAQIFGRPQISPAALYEAEQRVLSAELGGDLVLELERAFDALRAAGADGVAVRSSRPGA